MPQYKVYIGPKKGKYITLSDGRKKYLKSFIPTPPVELKDGSLYVNLKSRQLSEKRKRSRTRKRKPKAQTRKRKPPPRKLKTRYSLLRTRKKQKPKKKHRKKQIPPEIKEYEHIIKDHERLWNKLKPKTQKERKDLLTVCGDNCFLDNYNTNNYAICRKCDRYSCQCFPDCNGLLHVARKAIKDKNTGAAAAYIAHSLAQELGCTWKTALTYLEDTAHQNF